MLTFGKILKAMSLKFTVLGLLIFCSSCLFGQNEGLKFRNYGIRDGLSQSSIAGIFQDKKGFLWFGTSDGLNQFDGYKFKVYKNNYKNYKAKNSIYRIY